MASLKRKAPADTANSAKKPKSDSSLLSFFTPPKAAAPAETKFDKVKWVNSLTSEQRKLLQLEIAFLHESWLYHLKDEVTSREFLDLKRFLEREFNGNQKIFPPKEDIYSWSHHTPFHNVKIVIIGQDPYHNERQAHGLAFSVRPPTSAPPSLRNMFVALKKDYPSFVSPPKNGGLLTPWAERGVLMLNTCLTVRAHQANSHANRGWERFTQKVIDIVAAKRTRGVVFMAWGSPAGKRVAKIDQNKHLVLKSVHPSPLSANRGFFDCGHFRKSNEWLVTRYGPGSEVDWSLGGPPAPEPSGKKVEKGEVAGKMADGKKAEGNEEADKESSDKKEETATPAKEKGEEAPKVAGKKAEETEEAKKDVTDDETEENE